LIHTTPVYTLVVQLNTAGQVGDQKTLNLHCVMRNFNFTDSYRHLIKPLKKIVSSNLF